MKNSCLFAASSSAAFLLVPLLVGTQQAQAARAPISVKYGETDYCIGFDNSVDFYWPGKGGGKNGKGLQPGESKGNQTMGQWEYDNQPW